HDLPVDSDHHGLLHFVRSYNPNLLYPIAALALDGRAINGSGGHFSRGRGRFGGSLALSRGRLHSLRLSTGGFRSSCRTLRLLGWFFFLFSSKHLFSRYARLDVP